jgi:perosamine synthetase
MANNNVTNPSKYLGNELDYLKKVLEGESWSATGGSWTNGLERAFAKKIGTKYGVAFNSGTSTLHAAIEAAGVKPGDEVISPAITVIMNSTATFHANAVPVYCDVLKDTFTMDPADLKRKITPRTKAIIPVAIYGLPCDMDPIMEIARENNIVVIEDDAQAVLSKYKDSVLGTIGHMASFSFENTKHISCGEGGMIVTNNEQYAETVRKIGGHGFKNLKAEEGRVRLNADVFQNPDYKRHDVLGWNYRLSEFNAAVAFAQLERVDELVDLRIKSANIFIEVMKECDYLIPQALPEGYISSYYTLGVVYKGDESVGVSWQDFRKAYINAGGDGIYGAWSVPYLEPMIADKQFASRNPEIYKNVGYEKGLCPIAETLQSKLMQFKTNYRNIELAKTKAGILKKVIGKFKR